MANVLERFACHCDDMSLVNFQRMGGFEVRNAIGYAEHRSRSHDAVMRVYDEAGNVIETHEHADDFKEPRWSLAARDPNRMAFSHLVNRAKDVASRIAPLSGDGRIDNLFFEFAMIFFRDRAPLVLR